MKRSRSHFATLPYINHVFGVSSLWSDRNPCKWKKIGSIHLRREYFMDFFQIDCINFYLNQLIQCHIHMIKQSNFFASIYPVLMQCLLRRLNSPNWSNGIREWKEKIVCFWFWKSTKDNADVIVSYRTTVFTRIHFICFSFCTFQQGCAINNLFTKVSFFCFDFYMLIFGASSLQDSRKIQHLHTKSLNSLNRAEYRSSAC